MAGLVTIAELTARPGFDNLDSTIAQALIDDASALVRDAASPLLDDVESPDTPAAVVAVLVNMIRRGLDNPNGYTQEVLGDYSRTVGTTGGVATLYLTTRERRIVRRAVGKLGVGSLALTSDMPHQVSDHYHGIES